MPWTQKPAPRSDVPRPATGETPIQHVRIDQQDWDDFKALYGRSAPAVIRAFVAWQLRRKGAKLPQRPPAKS